MPNAPLPGPYGLYTVSVLPRFLLGSEGVGWQGAYFADIEGAPEGVVDHGHERYCVQRGMHQEQRRALGRKSWLDFPRGFSVWRPGDEQRFQWRHGGHSQFLFIAPAQVEAVLGEARPLAGLGHAAPLRSRLLELTFDALQADLAQGSPAGPLVGESLIAALIAQLAGPQGPSAGRVAARNCGRAIELVEARYADALTLQELAQAEGLGPRQFARAFRQATGRSPYQYLLQRRVERAMALIGEGLPLAEVAAQCGFSDQSQLTRVFVGRTGTTPGRYRRQLSR
jgi:AraC-like DNA-binding protein